MPQELAYRLAKCCSPQVGDSIIGYFKVEGTIAVHRSDCASVQHLRLERLLDVTWPEIKSAQAQSDVEVQDSTLDQLDDTDYFLLKHHQEFGVDYSIVVSETLRLLSQRHSAYRSKRCTNAIEN